MLLEHTFITTMDEAEALQTCSALLASHGFAPPERPAVSAGDDGRTELELVRGRKSASRAKTVIELPQQVVVQFDRGRITLAARVSPRTRYGREYLPRAVTATSRKKPEPLQQEMLLAIAEAIEQRLAIGNPPEQCLQRLDRAEEAIGDYRKRQRRKHWIMLGVLVLLCAGTVAWIIYSLGPPAA